MSARNQEIVSLYLTGEYTLQKISNIYGITRERVRQICSKNLDRKVVIEAKEKRFLLRIARDYGSLENYAKIQEEKQAKLLLKEERKGKWHLKYDACIGCGTTERPHQSRGRCGLCYAKYCYNNLPGRKEKHKVLTKNWRLKNLDKVRVQQRKYHKEYAKRPEVKVKSALYKKKRMENPEYREKVNSKVREHYRINNEQCRKRNRRYYKKNRKKILERNHQYYLTHKEKFRESSLKWNETHKEQLKEKRRINYISNKIMTGKIDLMSANHAQTSLGKKLRKRTLLISCGSCMGVFWEKEEVENIKLLGMCKGCEQKLI
jgi:hypothetical protein